jgi:2-isopropylmalate synthase
MKKLIVTDVTLKEAEKLQKFTFREKLNIATALEKAGLNAIELPYLSGDKEQAVVYKTISESVSDIKVCIDCGMTEADVETAYSMISGAKNKCIQVSVPVSTAQMEYIYHVKAPKMIAIVEKLVRKAKTLSNDVEFIAKDAMRAESGFLKEICTVAVKSGATAVTISDDAGDAFPDEMAKSVKEIKSANEIPVYVAPSNKLQMASAIAVECIKAGADGVKTVEKDGYLSAVTFAEIIRSKGINFGISSDVDVAVVKTVLSGFSEMSEKEEQVTSTSINLSAENTLSDVIDVVKSLGYELSDIDFGNVYEEFKRVCAKKGSVNKTELEAIVANTSMQVPSTYHLISYVVNSGNILTSTANITLEKDGEKLSGVSTGDGPIDASFHAIEQIIGHHYELDDFQVQAVTKGREAVGSSLIRLRADGKLYSGTGLSTDIIGACIRAYVNALNKIVYEDK